uniref:LAM_G_DOMAIN domain-containing protein n=1 Tax=Macrostomum lignano TaxID=282301 RepID=A0A1I8FG98_9PLAT
MRYLVHMVHLAHWFTGSRWFTWFTWIHIHLRLVSPGSLWFTWFTWFTAGSLVHLIHEVQLVHWFTWFTGSPGSQVHLVDTGSSWFTWFTWFTGSLVHLVHWFTLVHRFIMGSQLVHRNILVQGVNGTGKNFKQLETSEIGVGPPSGLYPDGESRPRQQPQQQQNFFFGSMSHFSFNGVDYFDARLRRQLDEASSTTVEVTAIEDDSPVEVLLPFTVRAPQAFAELPTLNLVDGFDLRLRFRTVQTDGLLLISAGGVSRSADFLLLELLNGRLRLALNPGLTSVATQRELPLEPGGGSTTTSGTCCGVATASGWCSGWTVGLPARQGFVGDVGDGGFNVNVNKNSFRRPLRRRFCDVLDRRLNRNEFVTDLVPSCQRPKIECHREMCYYGGQCLQQRDSVAFANDTTSFTWRLVQQSWLVNFSNSAVKGSGPARLSFEFADDTFLPTTKRDDIAFGFQTAKESAPLLRVDARDAEQQRLHPHQHSHQSPVQDNMKSSTISLEELAVVVSDGRYHRISNGAKIRHPTPAAQLASRGGRESQQYFQGYLVGLVFNGLPLNRIAAGDEAVKDLARLRIEREGDVQQVADFLPNLPGFPPVDRPEYYRNPDLMPTTVASSSSSGEGAAVDGDKTSAKPPVQAAKINLFVIVAVGAAGRFSPAGFLLPDLPPCRSKNEGSYRADGIGGPGIQLDPALKPLRSDGFASSFVVVARHANGDARGAGKSGSRGKRDMKR